MKVVLKEISVLHACLFLWICEKNITYVLYDLVSTCRLVVLIYNAIVHIQFFDDLRGGIKLRTHNITKIVSCKNMNDSCGPKLKLSNHYETADPMLRTS